MTHPLDGIRLVAYSPSTAAQGRLWTVFPEQQIAVDFATLAGLGASAVRMSLWPDVMGWPAPTDLMRARWYRLVSLAAAAGLRLKVDLFGGRAPWMEPDLADVCLRSLFEPYRNCRSLFAAVSLFNEGDPANPAFTSWLRTAVPHARDYLGLPVTVSVRMPQLPADPLGPLAALVAAGLPLDFLEVHCYLPFPLARYYLAGAQQLAGAMPIYVGETGCASDPAVHPGPVRTAAWWQWYQGRHYAGVCAACEDLWLPLPGYWCYSDYASDAFATLQPAAEYSYGLVGIDGSLKPAEIAAARWFVEGLRPDLDFNGALRVDESGIPPGWSRTGSATFGYDADSRAVSIADAPALGDPAGWYVTPIQPVRPGRSYVARCLARGDGLSGVGNLRLAWFDASGRFIRANASPSIPGGNSVWAPLEVTGVAAGAYCQIHFSLRGAGRASFCEPTFGMAAMAA